jgi:hypothetical protein
MNPMMSKFLGPPPGAVTDSNALGSIMQERYPTAGEVSGMDMSAPAPMAPQESQLMSGPAPTWQDANPFKDDNGNQRLSYNPDQYTLDGLGNSGADAPGAVSGNDDLAASLLEKAQMNKELSRSYQDTVVQQNEDEALQSKKMNQPAPGY